MKYCSRIVTSVNAAYKSFFFYVLRAVVEEYSSICRPRTPLEMPELYVISSAWMKYFMNSLESMRTSTSVTKFNASGCKIGIRESNVQLSDYTSSKINLACIKNLEWPFKLWLNILYCKT